MGQHDLSHARWRIRALAKAAGHRCCLAHPAAAVSDNFPERLTRGARPSGRPAARWAQPVGHDGAVSPSDGSIHVRVARAADEATLARLDGMAWSPDSGFPSVITSADSFFTPASPPNVHLVGEIDGTAVGYVRLRPPTHLPENAHVIEVSGLAVHPAARRRGVASALLRAAEQRARGARKLSLRVLSTNKPAIRLYRKLGFEREGTLRQEFLINGQYVDDLLMAKLLRRADRGAARPRQGARRSGAGDASGTTGPLLHGHRPLGNRFMHRMAGKPGRIRRGGR